MVGGSSGGSGSAATELSESGPADIGSFSGSSLGTTDFVFSAAGRVSRVVAIRSGGLGATNTCELVRGSRTGIGIASNQTRGSQATAPVAVPRITILETVDIETAWRC